METSRGNQGQCHAKRMKIIGQPKYAEIKTLAINLPCL